MKRMMLGLGIAVLMLSMGCQSAKPIKIGLSVQLTGKQAELGIQQRNGALMAVEEINERGGIGGRPIEMILKDDFGTPEGAIASDKELIAQNVVCIVGHATSAITMAALPVSEEAGVILMSPTTSTADLSGKDDHFFRIIQSLSDRAKGLAAYIYEEDKISELAVIYDEGNKAYSGSYWSKFEEEYKDRGGIIVSEQAFDSSEDSIDFDEMIAISREKGAKGLLFIASDTDAALMAQRVKVFQWDVPLYSSAWAQTEVLIKNGGKAVEGMILEQSTSLQSEEPRYIEFKKKFTERYGKEPSFASVFGYETILTLEKALTETKGEAVGLKEALLKIKDFNGLMDTFSIDPYGDVMRPYYLGIIKDGKYVDLNSFDPKK